MIRGLEESTIGAGKRNRFEDLRRLLGDAKRQAGQEVVGVRSVEKTEERSLRKDRIMGDGTVGRRPFWGQKLEQNRPI